MKQISQISIPKPCNQNWNDMQPDDNGRFCNNCQKSVIDFTQLSNNQIINLLDSSSNVCVRIDQVQLSSLNNDLLPKYRIPAWQKVGLLASVISLMPFVAAKAQVKLKVEQHKPFKPLVGTISAKAPFTTITGNVIDSISNQPVAFVAIEAIDSNSSAVTDSLGKFTIDVLPAIDTALTFSAVGHQTRSIRLTKDQTEYNIPLSAQSISSQQYGLTGLVGGLVVKRSLLWSAWYHIKQPFKHIFK